jgi:hypothetical protein
VHAFPFVVNYIHECVKPRAKVFKRLRWAVAQVEKKIHKNPITHFIKPFPLSFIGNHKKPKHK